MSLQPAGAGAATIVSAAALFLLSPRLGCGVYALSLAGILVISACGNTSRVGVKVVAWTVPFALPLLVIHGVLNSQYPVTGWWLDAIPIRRTGLTFGAEMSLRVVVLSIVAGFWLSVDRDALVESLLRLRLPTSLIMLPVQGVVMSRLIQIRIEKILLAQQARGTPVSGSFIQRLLSLPSLLVPVVVGTFVEAEARVSVLLAHGYGRLEPARRSSGMELRTVVVTVAALLCLGVALLADRTW